MFVSFKHAIVIFNVYKTCQKPEFLY